MVLLSLEKQSGTRESFSNKLGFVMACIGSAVGMGNIWLFPYRVGEFGGAAFLIPYIIFTTLLGFTGVAGEMAFGRAMQTGPLGSFKKAFEKRGKKYGEFIGLIPVIGSLGIAIGFSVVCAWILRFLVGSLTGSLINSTSSIDYFKSISGDFGSIPWHLTVLVIILIILSLGVSHGIEKINKVLMPSFFILFTILAIKTLFLEGTFEGYKYLFIPKWEYLKNVKTWIFALGQAFFSLSIAGSGTIVYGSYLKDDEDIIDSAKYVVIFDTIAALLSAMVIIPSVFAYGMDPTAGPPLMFITLPSVFKQMPLGGLFSVIFFMAVLFAAITSLMNLLETPIETLQHKFNLSRKISVFIIVGIVAIVGTFIQNVNMVGLVMDVLSIYIIPLGALLAGISFYWICGKKFAREKIQKGREKPLGSWFEPITNLFIILTFFVYILGIIFGGIG